MIVKLYKSNLSVGLILIPIIVTILCLPLFINTVQPESYFYIWQQPIFDFVLEIPLLNFILSIFILILNSALISQSFNKTVFFSKTTYLPSIIYIVLVSFMDTIQFSPILIIHLLTIIVFNQLIKLNVNDSALHIAFKTGLLIGVMGCFNLLYSFFIFALLIGIYILQSFKLRETIISLLGLSIPLIYLFSSQYIFNNSNFDLGAFNTELDKGSQVHLVNYIQIICIGMVSLVSLKMMFTFNNHNSISIKKQISIITIALIISVGFFAFNYYNFNTFNFLFVIPLSFVTSIAGFSSQNYTLLSLLLTISLIVNIVSLFIT